MRPAVPPEFRLKANTLTADNGACRTELPTFALIRSAPKGNARQRGIHRFQPWRCSLKYRYLCLRASSSHFLLYNSIPYFWLIVKHFLKKGEKKEASSLTKPLNFYFTNVQSISGKEANASEYLL